MNEEPVLIEDERVGKHFEHARYGTTYVVQRAVMFNNHKFLTLVEVYNEKREEHFNELKAKRPSLSKLPKTVSTISWCCTDDADFYMNFIEM